MDEQFIRDRITQLRLKKDISEYQLSYDLGHSRGYINNISSGKALPSMSEFLYICDYFHITPKDFFDTENPYPDLVGDIVTLAAQLDKESLHALRTIMQKML